MPYTIVIMRDPQPIELNFATLDSALEAFAVLSSTGVDATVHASGDALAENRHVSPPGDSPDLSSSS